MKKENIKFPKIAKPLFDIITKESNNGICNLSDPELGKRMGISSSYVQSILRRMRKAGFINSNRIGKNRREIRILKIKQI